LYKGSLGLLKNGPKSHEEDKLEVHWYKKLPWFESGQNW